MAEIHGLREQILANYSFMGFNQPTSQVDVVVRFLDQAFYRATIVDKSSGRDIWDEPHKADTVEGALDCLLSRTCAYLGHPPNMIGAGSSQAAAIPTAKPRGRPKNVLHSSTANPKPKQIVSSVAATADPSVKRGRGRPRKSDVSPAAGQNSAVEGIKRARGRPRKNPLLAAISQADGTAPEKRGRGRPRKSLATPTTAISAEERTASALGDEPTSPSKACKTTDEDLQDGMRSDEEVSEEEAE